MDRPPTTNRRPLVVNSHRKRSVRIWIIPLIGILVVIYFLPRLLTLLEG
ncbi:MAG: hypothetical protein KOO60_12185 [Gemmatimonadales bacterium]|nr:hypothetical protein [Gemmatimonadales bacterium]